MVVVADGVEQVDEHDYYGVPEIAGVVGEIASADELVAAAAVVGGEDADEEDGDHCCCCCSLQVDLFSVEAWVQREPNGDGYYCWAMSHVTVLLVVKLV